MIAPGTHVRVRLPTRLGHFRVPGYIQGRRGVVVRRHGSYPCAEDLGVGKKPCQTVLYSVAFCLQELWGEASGESILVDLYEHWLDVLDTPPEGPETEVPR